MNGKMMNLTFFQLYTLYVKNCDNSFSTLLATVTFLNKDTSVDTDTDSCVTTYKYLNKLVSEV